MCVYVRMYRQYKHWHSLTDPFCHVLHTPQPNSTVGQGSAPWASRNHGGRKVSLTVLSSSSTCSTWDRDTLPLHCARVCDTKHKLVRCECYRSPVVNTHECPRIVPHALTAHLHRTCTCVAISLSFSRNVANGQQHSLPLMLVLLPLDQNCSRCSLVPPLQLCCSGNDGQPRPDGESGRGYAVERVENPV